LLDPISAEYERAPEVGLELLEDRPEVGERDVVGPDQPVGGVFPVWQERVRAGPDDAFVPVPGPAEHLVGQIADAVAYRTLTLAGCDQAAVCHRGEQRRRLVLGRQQPFRAPVLIHHDTTITPEVGHAIQLPASRSLRESGILNRTVAGHTGGFGARVQAVHRRAVGRRGEAV
jgi:hypothetical protein